MKYNLDVHQRCSIRIKNYDYSQAGAYFITLCIQNRECLLDEIIDGKMQLSPSGENVFLQWINLSQRFSGLELDEFVVMPNYLHAIISLTLRAGHNNMRPYVPIQVIDCLLIRVRILIPFQLIHIRILTCNFPYEGNT